MSNISEKNNFKEKATHVLKAEYHRRHSIRLADSTTRGKEFYHHMDRHAYHHYKAYGHLPKTVSAYTDEPDHVHIAKIKARLDIREDFSTIREAVRRKKKKEYAQGQVNTAGSSLREPDSNQSGFGVSSDITGYARSD